MPFSPFEDQRLIFVPSIIALHRPAFLSAPAWLKDRIDEHCAGTPWGDRLRYSLCIGSTSARAILKALSDLLLYSRLSRIITVNQMLPAILVLAIYMTKIPNSLMHNSDMAVSLHSIARYICLQLLDAQHLCIKDGERILEDGTGCRICDR
jgi:hypothetical protein